MCVLRAQLYSNQHFQEAVDLLAAKIQAMRSAEEAAAGGRHAKKDVERMRSQRGCLHALCGACHDELGHKVLANLGAAVAPCVPHAHSVSLLFRAQLSDGPSLRTL